MIISDWVGAMLWGGALVTVTKRRSPVPYWAKVLKKQAPDALKYVAL